MSAQFGILSRPMRTLNQSQSLSFTPMSLSTCSCADGMCVRSLLPLNDCVMQRRTNRLGGRRIYFAMTNDEGSSEKMSSHRHEFLLIQSSWVVIFWFLINWTVNSVRSRSSQFCSMLQNDNGNSRLQCFLSVCQTFPLSLERARARASFVCFFHSEFHSMLVSFFLSLSLPLSFFVTTQSSSISRDFLCGHWMTRFSPSSPSISSFSPCFVVFIRSRPIFPCLLPTIPPLACLHASGCIW